MSGGNVRAALQFKREPAHFWWGASCDFAHMAECASVDLVAKRSSKRIVADCQHRYPSPDRSALTQGRPVSHFRSFIGGNRVDIGYHRRLAIELMHGSADFGATLKTTLGREKCRKHLSSLPQWLSLVLLAVLKATWNAVWLALAPVWSQQKFWVQIVQGQSWPVQLQACCATTQVSTAVDKPDNRAHCGRLSDQHCRRGFASAAVLRFGDGI